MGASSSTPWYEAVMPPMNPVRPTGVFANFTVHPTQVELEFNPASAGSTINDLHTGAAIFTIGERSSGKFVIGDATRGVNNTILNIYPAFWGGKWEIKGGEMPANGMAPKALYAKVKDVGKGSHSTFTVAFASMPGSEKCEPPSMWHLSWHEERKSTLISLPDGQELAHVGLRENTTPGELDSIVLTAAPGADIAMLVAICVCQSNHESSNGSSSNHIATGAAVNAAAAGSVC